MIARGRSVKGMDREKVIAWLTEISLRPCDFTRDDFDETETERLANDAIEIVEDAEIFCKQRNDAIALLKEQEEQIDTQRENITILLNEQRIVRCKDCRHGAKTQTFRYYPEITWCNKHSTSHNDDWFCADGKVKLDE